MIRRPGESATAIVVLALGIGLAGTGWAVVWGTYLRPVPVPDSDRLVRVSLEDPEDYDGHATIGYDVFRALHDDLAELESLDRLEAWTPLAFDVSGLPGPSVKARGTSATHGLLDLTGAAPLQGRFLTAYEVATEARVVVASEEFWRENLAAAPLAAGSVTLRINGNMYRVVGVLPAGVQFPYRQDLWLPARAEYMGAEWMEVIARLGDGVSLETAREELAAAVAHLPAARNDGEARDVSVEPLRDTFFDDRMRSGVVAAAAAALGILLLACANVANLLLARGLRRRREMAVRTSLGARRRQLVAQLLLETSLLAAVGGIVGLAFCRLGIHLWNLYTAGIGMPYWVAVEIDPQVLAAITMFVLASSVVAGLFPAWRQSSASVSAGAVRDQHVRTRADAWLVVMQVAGSVAILATCAVLVRTVERLEAGREYLLRSDVVIAQLSLRDDTVDRSVERYPIWDRILRRVASEPDVRRVAMVSSLPEDGAGYDGRAETPDGRTLDIRYGVSSPGAFDLVGARVLAGRDFAVLDHMESEKVALVDEDLARDLFPGLPLDQVVGRSLRAGHKSENFPKFPMRTIVGVVSDLGAGAEAEGVGASKDPVPQAFLPLSQMNMPGGDLVLEIGAGSASIAHRLALAVEEVAPGHPLYEVQTLREILDRRTRVESSARAAFSVLAVVALALAAAGLYGVLAVQVGRRRQELAVRTALGATPGDLLRRVLGSGLSLVALGCAAGLFLAYGSTQAVQSLLHGAEPWDPIALTAAVCVLMAAGLVASWIPARRAASIEPASALRED